MKKLLFILLLLCSACAVTQTTEKCDKEKKNVVKLFDILAKRYKDRKGGYTRIVKLADGRVGDNAEMSYIMLV